MSYWIRLRVNREISSVMAQAAGCSQCCRVQGEPEQEGQLSSATFPQVAFGWCSSALDGLWDEEQLGEHVAQQGACGSSEDIWQVVTNQDTEFCC